MDDFLEWATNQPLFTLNEAQRVTGLKRASLRQKLSRLVNRSELTRIERGKYTTHDDPMIYGTYLETPSYFSLWTGLRFYDLTTQEPATAQVMTAENRPSLTAIDFFKTGAMFGFGKQKYMDFDIFVAEQERLLLDCLDRKQVPVTELRRLVQEVDIPLVSSYADRLGKNSVKKRLGYLLETVRGETVDSLRVADRNYPRLDLSRPADGRSHAKWGLRVNADVV